MGMVKFLPFFVLIFVFGASGLQAQQDPMFTKYMFNGLTFNPAYAGSKDHLYLVALNRSQWINWNNGLQDGQGGAPTTQTISGHSPINRKISIGGSIVNDRIGANESTAFNFAYAYKIPFGQGKLSLGLQAGLIFWRANWSDLNYKDPRSGDAVFNQEDPNQWLPNFGAGAYYSDDRFYVGVAVPRLGQFALRDKALLAGNVEYARQYRHLYISAGAAFPIDGDNLVFRPSVLIKNVGLLDGLGGSQVGVQDVGAPSEFDLDASLLFRQQLWVGLSFRSSFQAFVQNDATNRQLSSFDSVDLWFTWLLENGMRIGAGYDYPLNALGNYHSGSVELMLAYEFKYEVKRMASPRYF